MKKGRLQEALSKARYADDPSLYTVVYRDFDRYVEVSLLEFLRLSSCFESIPASRIVEVKRQGTAVYSKK